MRYKVGATWSRNDPRPAHIMSAPVRGGGLIGHVSGSRDDEPIWRTEDDGAPEQQKSGGRLASVRGKE